jgi:hypothetical protein
MLCVALVNIKFMRYVAVNDTFKVHGAVMVVIVWFYGSCIYKVVVFTTTCAISAYYLKSYRFESHSW